MLKSFKKVLGGNNLNLVLNRNFGRSITYLCSKENLTTIRPPTDIFGCNYQYTVDGIRKESGDNIKQGEPALNLFADIISVDVEAPISGKIYYHVKQNQDVTKTDALFDVSEDDKAIITKKKYFEYGVSTDTISDILPKEYLTDEKCRGNSKYVRYNSVKEFYDRYDYGTLLLSRKDYKQAEAVYNEMIYFIEKIEEGTKEVCGASWYFSTFLKTDEKYFVNSDHLKNVVSSLYHNMGVISLIKHYDLSNIRPKTLLLYNVFLLQAWNYFDKSIERKYCGYTDKVRASSYCYLAHIKSILGCDRQEVLQLYKQALEIFPNHLRTHFNLACIYMSDPDMIADSARLSGYHFGRALSNDKAHVDKDSLIYARVLDYFKKSTEPLTMKVKVNSTYNEFQFEEIMPTVKDLNNYLDWRNQDAMSIYKYMKIYPRIEMYKPMFQKKRIGFDETLDKKIERVRDLLNKSPHRLVSIILGSSNEHKFVNDTLDNQLFLESPEEFWKTIVNGVKTHQSSVLNYGLSKEIKISEQLSKLGKRIYFIRQDFSTYTPELLTHSTELKIDTDVSGISWSSDKTNNYHINLHGTIHELICPKCFKVFDNNMYSHSNFYTGGEIIPVCSSGVKLKPNIALHGDPVDIKKVETAKSALKYSDLLIIVDAKTDITPTSDLIKYAKNSNKCVIEISPNKQAIDSPSDYYLEGDPSNILEGLIKGINN